MHEFNIEWNSVIFRRNFFCFKSCFFNDKRFCFNTFNDCRNIFRSSRGRLSRFCWTTDWSSRKSQHVFQLIIFLNILLSLNMLFRFYFNISWNPSIDWRGHCLIIWDPNWISSWFTFILINHIKHRCISHEIQGWFNRIRLFDWFDVLIINVVLNVL